MICAVDDDEVMLRHIEASLPECKTVENVGVVGGGCFPPGGLTCARLSEKQAKTGHANISMRQAIPC